MKPFEEIEELRSIVAHTPNSATAHHADYLIDALKRTARGLNERINSDALHELEKLDLLVPTLLGVPMEPPLPDSNPENIRLVISGVLTTLERYFADANVS